MNIVPEPRGLARKVTWAGAIALAMFTVTALFPPSASAQAL